MEPREVLETESSEEFFQLMKNRMVVSYFKYGPLATAYPHKVDAIGSLTERLLKYSETGNKEWLVDAANFCMIEFMHPRHPEAHMRGTDAEESPGRRVRKTGLLTQDSNADIGRNPRSRTAQFRGKE